MHLQGLVDKDDWRKLSFVQLLFADPAENEWIKKNVHEAEQIPLAVRFARNLLREMLLNQGIGVPANLSMLIQAAIYHKRRVGSSGMAREVDLDRGGTHSSFGVTFFRFTRGFEFRDVPCQVFS